MLGLYWVRTDLRLSDNQALNAFLNECTEGIILWCPSKHTLKAGSFRKDFLEDMLFHFHHNLSEIGQILHIGNDKILNELPHYFKEFSFDKIYYSSLSSIDEKKDEVQVQAFCHQHNIECESFDQETLIFEKDLPFIIEEMPFIFSDFRKKVEQDLSIRSPVNLSLKRNQPLKKDNSFTKIKAHSGLLFSGGEEAAFKRLTYYFGETKAILTYKDTRNGMLHENDSSRLSPWLSLGAISPRIIMHQLRSFESTNTANDSTYWLLLEMLWRDYMKFFSRKYQRQLFLEDGVKKSKNYSPKRNKSLFQAWCRGETAEPFINANMKELNLSGWMSNRGRQNVASYLVHYLKIPWTWGAAYFEKQLIDYDCDLNWGNWLYLSGNGTDPRSRIFNIKRQSEIYDPDFLYQKKWNQ